MSANSHHASYKDKDYTRKDFNYGPTRDFSSEKSAEPSSTKFSSSANRNSPLSFRSQKDLMADSFDKNSTNKEPSQVKYSENQQQYQHSEHENEEANVHAQPIINEKTLLALEYLQKYLLPNKTVQPANNVSADDDIEVSHSHNERSPREYKSDANDQGNSKIGEFSKVAKDSNNLTGADKYERSRSRSNEKKGSFDRTTVQINNYKTDSNERYKPGHYNKSYEEGDWECSKCGNVNWTKRGNCSRCGHDKIDHTPQGKQNMNKSLEGKEDGGFDKGLDYHNNKDQYYKGINSNAKRNDYRNISTRNNNFSSPKQS